MPDATTKPRRRPGSFVHVSLRVSKEAQDTTTNLARKYKKTRAEVYRRALGIGLKKLDLHPLHFLLQQ